MTKVYIANTPLILEDAQGSQFRVELGEKVELTPEQVSEIGFGRFVTIIAEHRTVAGMQNGQLIAILEQRDGQLYKPKKVIK